MNITEQSNAKNGFSRNLAFIIGINNYSNGVSPLKTAVNDAKKLAETLREKHGYEVWICLDEVATLGNLNKLLEKTLPAQVSENDRLLFYFAGHGVALNGDDGPAGYLIPQDAKQGDIDSYLPMTKLHDALSQLPCRHFLGILDCCFAGAFRWSSNRDLLTTPEVIHKERYDRFIADPAWQIITSSASDQKALDNFKLDTERGEVGNHSPFAAALLEALEGAADAYPPGINGKSAGDGVITATELYLYLRDRVEIPTEKYRLRQTPGIWCLNKHDKGEYIFLSPGHELNLPPAPPLDRSQNPYRGLKSFEEKHSQLFFGRSRLVQRLQAFVNTHPLTVVLGTSGSGKSSLVKAGLIPKLKKATEDTNEKWCILSPIRPGETPLQALNNALTSESLPIVELNKQQKTLSESISVWVKNHPNSKLLIYIDQSEELITLCQNENERKEFFQQILTAINHHRHQLRVILTLRSDFEPQVRDAGLKFVCEELNSVNTFLQKRWQSGRFIVPAMTRGELREAIEKPAETRVIYFQPHDLVEELIDEVHNMPGGLPLLSFALSELYLKYLQRQHDAQNNGVTIDRALTQQDYEELGGVIQSLTQRADEEYEALVQENPAYAWTIRHVMLRMVRLGGELSRRQVRLSELDYQKPENQRVNKVLQRFIEARLVVTGKDIEDKPYVEPAHDILITGWGKLITWIKDEPEVLLLQRRLTLAAENWQLQHSLEFDEFSSFKKAKGYLNREDYLKTQTASNFLWSADPYLDGLKHLLTTNDNNWLNKNEMLFVQRSLRRRRVNRSFTSVERTFTAVIFLLISITLFVTGHSNLFLRILGFVVFVSSLLLFKSLFR
jgi:Caspase domain